VILLASSLQFSRKGGIVKDNINAIFFFALFLVLLPGSSVTCEEAVSENVFLEQGTPDFTVQTFVICTAVHGRSPSGVGAVFPSHVRKLYAFLEVTDIVKDSLAVIIWYFKENPVAAVHLDLKKGDRWRTYASKNIGKRSGSWKVELRDTDGHTLTTVPFTVE